MDLQRLPTEIFKNIATGPTCPYGQLAPVYPTNKCVFGKTSVKFLGCLITAEGVKPLLEKVAVISNFP